MATDEDMLEAFKKEFKKETEGITNIEELKELYSREIARRDKIIAELQKQNDIILKTAFKQKDERQNIQKKQNAPDGES
ncbi:MAG: hypothetical protein ACLFTH_04040 [Candidatus Woesearchaeota archaeon]